MPEDLSLEGESVRAAEVIAALSLATDIGIAVPLEHVCLLERSNLRPGAVRSLEEHPLPALIAAGVPCSLSTDDPALFGTNLAHEYETARTLGLQSRDFYAAGVEGALFDSETRERLQRIGEAFAWAGDDASPEGQT